MTLEEVRVITIVYVSALAPLFIYFYKKDKIPLWVPSIYLGSFILCSLGWELWFTYGWVDGDPVNIRRSETLNQWIPIHANWLLNSMADAGTISIGGLWLMWKYNEENSQVFQKWNWPAFSILFLWCITQNLLVELFLYHDQLAEGKSLSWAPLAPTGQFFNPLLFEFNGRSVMFQTQLPWLIMSPILYIAAIAMARKA
ncbi:hypothetical protein N9Y44_00455 [Gammaproteobacteria bacterium]|nr:hypothetical protein [Gammaproteobacteria bacterium]|tara:strand:+ start:808 stop:1404 length:597 start_codon:yes stop_codon:yes gene_type:complete